MNPFSYTPLDRTITIRKPVASTDFDGAGLGTWVDVATVKANVQDLRMARAERMAEVVNIASRPARILIRYRDDITPDMQIVYGNRTMQIVGSIVELGRREGLELTAQDYSTSGNAA